MANNNFKMTQYNLKLGESFSEPANEFCYVLNYDNKPISLSNREPILTVQDQKVKITFPNTSEVKGVDNAVDYSGHIHEFPRECVLKINKETGEAVLEKISSQIILKREVKEAVKKAVPEVCIKDKDKGAMRKSRKPEVKPRKKYVTKKMKQLQAMHLKRLKLFKEASPMDIDGDCLTAEEALAIERNILEDDDKVEVKIVNEENSVENAKISLEPLQIGDLSITKESVVPAAKVAEKSSKAVEKIDAPKKKRGRKKKCELEEYRKQKLLEPVKPKRKYIKKADKLKEQTAKEVTPKVQKEVNDGIESAVRYIEEDNDEFSSDEEVIDIATCSFKILKAVGDNLNLGKKETVSKAPNLSDDDEFINFKPISDLDLFLDNHKLNLSESDTDSDSEGFKLM